MARLPFRLLNNWASVVVLLLLIGLPIYGPMMVYAEGTVFPVTTKITLEDPLSENGGIVTRFKYVKLRNCELVGAAWFVGTQEVDFHPIVGGTAQTRVNGPQRSRLWFIGATSLENSHVWFLHRCHPFWITATKVFG